MRILVTGGRGQLAQSLLKVGGEHEIVLTTADITSEEAMRGVMQGVDAAVNCAAWTDVDGAEREPDAAMRVNGFGAGVVASEAARRKIPLIHISTDYVFDGRATEPIPETAPTAPLGVYGKSKLAGEEAVRVAGGRVAIVRTAWLYSEYGNNFRNTMLRLGREGKALRVVNDQVGCPTHADDLARVILRLLEHGIGAGCEVYHYCGDRVMTWFDFAREIFAEAGMNVSVTPVTTAEYGALAPRPLYSVLDTKKISKLL